MGALEEFAKALILEDAKPDFTRGDSYLGATQLAGQVAGAIPVADPNYSLEEKIAAAAITGLLGGAAGQASQDYQRGQKDLYRQALVKNFLGDSSAVEDLDPTLFDVAAEKGKALSLLSVAEKQAAGTALEQQKGLELYKSWLENPHRTRRAIEMMTGETKPIAKTADSANSVDTGAAANAKFNAEATGGVVLPDAEPIAASADTLKAKDTQINTRLNQLLDATDGDEATAKTLLEKELAAPNEFAKDAREALKTGKISNDFGDLKTNFESMQDFYKFDDRASTTAFISAFARVLDPGSSVKEGEIKNAENTQSFLSGLGYNLNSLLTGTQQIDSKVKLQMLNAAGAKYNRFGQAYDEYLGKQKALVTSKGGNADEIFGPYSYKPFDIVQYAKNTKQTTLDAVLGAEGATQATGATPASTSIENQMRLLTQKRQSGAELSANEKAFVDKVRSMVGGQP